MHTTNYIRLLYKKGGFLKKKFNYELFESVTGLHWGVVVIKNKKNYKHWIKFVFGLVCAWHPARELMTLI